MIMYSSLALSKHNNILDNGKTMAHMAKAHTNSKITQSTVANSNIHKNTASAPITMQMVIYIKENSDVD